MKKVLLTILAVIATVMAQSQTRYQFHCTDFVSTDNSRAPQSAFSYDRKANMFSVNASGSNNGAFEMAQGTDRSYFIENDQTLFVMRGANLQATPSSAVIWWIKGHHNGADNPSFTVTSGNDCLYVHPRGAQATSARPHSTRW